MSREARGLSRMGVVPDAIVTSPLRRAVETGEILARELGVRAELSTEDVLAANLGPESIVRVLAESDARILMAVGHLPSIEHVATQLVAGGGGDHGGVAFHPGSVACLQFPEGFSAGRGVLEWLMSPDQLAAQAE